MAGHYLRLEVPDMYTAVYQLIVFLTDVVGWEIAEDVSDTGDIRDVVLTTTGEPEVPNGFPRYIRIRNIILGGERIYLHTYETFVDTITNTGEVYDSTYGSVWGINDSQGMEMVVVADLERVIITNYPYTGTDVYTGYVGRITSYYRANEHHYPNVVKGSTTTPINWYYSTTEANCFMIGPHGSKQHYHAVEPLNASTGLLAGAASDRNGTNTLAAPVLVNTDADSQRSELVGEPRGVYRISPEVSSSGAFLQINGDVYVTTVQNGAHMALGPIGTEAPSQVPGGVGISPTRDAKRAESAAVDLIAHWDETTIQSSGGTVTRWDDKTGNGWDLLPGTIAPLHLVSNQNGLDTVDCQSVGGYMDLDVSVAAPASGNTPVTFYMVLITDAVPGVDAGAPFDVTDGSFVCHHPYLDNVIYNDFGTTIRRSWAQNPSSVVHSWHVFSGVAADSNNKLDINGVLQFSTGASATSWRPVGASPWVIGGRLSASGAYKGRIGEVRFYEAEHSDALRQAITTSLKTKWGIV